jgi:hypothetical protein
VAQLADQTAMTTQARHDFYVNHPAIEDRSTFNNDCKSYGEQTIILGCYHGAQGGIYVFKVSDARLNGVEQVTAAHEMLHAAYDRLDNKERTHVNKMLQDYYASSLSDERVRKTIQDYQKTEPNDVINEMHSVFGTEVANLPPALEEYYQQYFTDRSKIIGFKNQYQGEFTGRETKVEADDAQLKAYKKQIDDNQTRLDAQLSELQAMRARLDQARTSNDIATYNSGVPAYNTAVTSYNGLARTTRALIQEYNQLVQERNALAFEVNSLAQAINSQPQSIK